MRASLLKLGPRAGGPFEGMHFTHLLETAIKRGHFDADEQGDLDRWRLVYLSRHARIEPAFFLAMTTKQVDAWVKSTSDMIREENKPRPKGQ